MLCHNLWRERTRAGDRHARTARLHRFLAPAATLVAATSLLAPGLARADSSTTLTVVGTTDLNDSGLVSKVIAPAFEGNYPQYTFKYVSATSSQAAITAAEAGGNSVLLAHAPSLENQFLAGGFSYEPYGRALFTNDYVLTGPTTDPAGVTANAANNVAQGFADVAVAGIAGNAQFVSRGGTSATTQQEHAIWAVVNSSSLNPPGLVLCTLNASVGGGDTPIAANAGIVNGAPCPGGGALPASKLLPKWYASTGLTQGPNVIAANACDADASGPENCYVFTDLGTYDYLVSGTDSAGTIGSLSVDSHNNSVTAPGGKGALVQYFHGYIINPSAPGETVNLTAAQDFLNLITSAPIQAAIADYLEGFSAQTPYTADAAPIIKTKALPSTFTASGPLTVSGTVTNAELGFPALSGVTVTLSRVTGDLSLPVASAKTDSTGAFTLKTSLVTKGSYVLSTPQFAQVESATLNPPFSDILTPAVTPPAYIRVRGAILGLSAESLGGSALITGAVGPSGDHVSGKVTVDARRLGVKGAAYRKVATTTLASDDGSFATVADLPAGRWQLKAYFADPGTVLTSRGHTATVTVTPASRAHIAGRGESVSKSGSLTARVALYPKAATGTTVRLVVVKLTGGGTAAQVLDTVKPDHATHLVTLHGTLKGRGRWAVLESYTVPGVGTTWTHAVGHVTIRKTTKKK